MALQKIELTSDDKVRVIALREKAKKTVFAQIARGCERDIFCIEYGISRATYDELKQRGDIK